MLLCSLHLLSTVAADDAMVGSNNDEDKTRSFWENLSLAQTVECLCGILPFLRKGKFIVESEYRLTLLDTVELLIALFEREVCIVNYKQKMQEQSEQQKLKVKENGKRNSKKNSKIARKKAA
jgi:hypothetical protein